MAETIAKGSKQPGQGIRNKEVRKHKPSHIIRHNVAKLRVPRQSLRHNRARLCVPNHRFRHSIMNSEQEGTKMACLSPSGTREGLTYTNALDKGITAIAVRRTTNTTSKGN
jgi:hypothetical protein